MRGLQVSIALALFCCSAFSYSLRLPRKQGAGILGQEEVGPIDDYTCPNDGVFPHEDCDYFVSCWDNRAVLWRCTDDMLFNLDYDGCDFAENTHCGDRRRPPDVTPTREPPRVTTTTDPSVSTTTKTPPNGTFECTENGAFAHEERCEYWWNCWEGEAFLMLCPGEYLFDLTYMGCNFPDLVDCGSRQRPDPPGSTVAPPTKPTDSPSSQPTDSPSSQPTDGPSSQPTDSPSSQQPTDSPSSQPTSGPTTENPGDDFQCPQPNGTFPDPVDCTKFYVCISNLPIHETCPDGLHYNPSLGQCDWPEDAGCAATR